MLSGPGEKARARQEIKKDTNFKNLSLKLSKLGAKTVLQSLDLIGKNLANFSDQDHKKATYAKKIDKAGILLIVDSFEKTLENFNIVPINPSGQEFDLALMDLWEQY